MPKKDNRDRKEYFKELNKSPHRRKAFIFNGWKSRGLKDDLEEVWKIYSETTECMICDVKLTTGRWQKTRKCMNHCHETGYYLNVICHECNVLPQFKVKVS